ncbi:hypothetical protein [Nocardia caishijiensis]|uniref:Uncharacterized protein n=1 Tax=Nocardia caishijiensis TaxID=184756 RepID=A0ABQ6YLE5_9NOCA|nr:hypothetical protein [Nocardia caishijiensis]KAF0846483.1 hypothetical protein FNL39_105398 [Nocardia caishijiensis]
MALLPDQPASTDPGMFPIPASGGRNQLRRKFRALARAIEDTWLATADSDVVMHPGHFHIDTEAVSIDVADAVTVMRTIDTLFTELLDPADKPRYEAMRASDSDGRVVHGLRLIRNAEIHRHAMIDMDTDRLVSGVGKGGWRVFPRWKPYSDLPVEIRNNTDGKRTSVDRRYEDSVGGRLVIETLLDVMRFFDRCDPSLTHRNEDGDIDGFPLPPFIIEHTYECRHPYDPREVKMNEILLDRWTIMAPTGLNRQIHRAVLYGDLTLYVGLTNFGHHLESFVESADQIAWDIAGGYSYTAITDTGRLMPVTEWDRTLMLGETPLAEATLAEVRAGRSTDSDDRIREWWDRQITDAFWYRRHRRAS